MAASRFAKEQSIGKTLKKTTIVETLLHTEYGLEDTEYGLEI